MRFFSKRTLVIEPGERGRILILLILLLITLGLALYGIAYASLTGKADDLVMMGVRRERLTDREGYKRHQGRFALLLGSIFLLVPVSLYVVERTSVDAEILYLWLVLLGVVVLTNAIQVRRFFN